MPKKLTPETALKRQVKQYLGYRGFFTFHILQGLGAYPGIADLIALKDGQTYFIELKRPKGVVSPRQMAFKADIEAKGGNYLIVRQIEDLQEAGL